MEASSSATAKPAAGRFSSWWKSKSSARSLARPWESRRREFEPRPQPDQWVSLMGPVDRWKRPRIVFQHGAGFDFVGQAAEIFAVADRQRLAWRRSFPTSPRGRRNRWRSQRIAPIVPPGSIRPAEAARAQRQRCQRRAGRGFLAGVGADRDGKGHPSHHGAIMPPAQPIREHPMRSHAHRRALAQSARPHAKNYCRVSLISGYGRRVRSVPEWGRSKDARAFSSEVDTGSRQGDNPPRKCDKSKT